MPNSKPATLPGKPRPDFPLFPHKGCRQWAKKVRGKTHYFGSLLADPNGKKALKKWLDEKEDLLAGRIPRPKVEGGATLESLLDRFIHHKSGLLETGELAPRTFKRYEDTCKVLINAFGLQRLLTDITADDFQFLRGELAKKWGPVSLGNEIQIIRGIFRFGFDSGLLDVPARFGPGFKKPSAKTLRLARAAAGPRLFTPMQIKALLAKANPNFRAMILLGIQAGLGNTDLGSVPIAAFDLKAAWLSYPRGKTGISRRIPLWKETIDAVKKVIKTRREPVNAADADLLFIGGRGENYAGDRKGYRVCQEFDHVRTAAGIIGRSFYDLRRTFQTIAEGCGDIVAVRAIMGHAASESDMSARYRQSVDDARLKKAVQTVHVWLFPPKKKAAKQKVKASVHSTA
ncbi:site-specific tyrosine recombinase XerC [Anatilimnocola aggregata]|uniref:Site-specific tyrosine recombinase XerC n=1 Tax=Anatilimnocola aggregata TaxID=2528021 RepID=A0A517YJA2_9BACT|nr:tyrosine-type recombinase/integrase [Anatilimnocola aggregata]QDU30296.1 site-specific tyrosine recombinase XerC [Anatilimnocola aggregata]